MSTNTGPEVLTEETKLGFSSRVNLNLRLDGYRKKVNFEEKYCLGQKIWKERSRLRYGEDLGITSLNGRTKYGSI